MEKEKMDLTAQDTSEPKEKKEEFEEEPISESDGLGLFHGEKKPDIATCWEFYEKGKEYNEQMGTDYRVQVCEDFYNNFMWKDIDSGDMPTPQFPVPKKLVNTFVGIMVSDKISLKAEPRTIAYDKRKAKFYTGIANKLLDYTLDINNFVELAKGFVKDAGVDGDGCLHFYWDEDYKTGDFVKGKHEVTGALRIERIYNTNVFFGNPMNANKEDQEYIIIVKRMPVRKAKLKAKNNGCEDWDAIGEDTDHMEHIDSDKVTNGDCTVCIMYWRDDDTGKIWACEYTQSCFIREPFDTGLTRYPIIWMSWDEIKNAYHGQSMLAGVVDNATMINREAAMIGISVDRNAYQTTIYDANRLPNGLDNSVGAQIGVQGGDLDNVFKTMEGTNVASTAFQYLELMYDKTMESMGASKVLTGDTKAYNTSAIVATSRNSLTIHEPTKISYHDAMRETGYIQMDFVAAGYYGERYVLVPIEFAAPQLEQAFMYSGMEVPEEVPILFDFDTMKDFPINIKFNASEGSFISQNMQQEKLDMLLNGGFIDIEQYLTRCPPEFIPDLDSLIKDKQEEKRMMQQQMGMQTGQSVTPNGVGLMNNVDKTKQEVPQGKGNGSMQREIAKTGKVSQFTKGA